MANKYIELNSSGELAQKEATVTSAGAGDAGEIVALDSNGKLDVTVMPTGIGPDVLSVVASEGLNAGSYVNLWNDAGTVKARLADNSNSRPAHGFVKTSVSSSATATVYFEGANDALSGLTGGSKYFLSTGGNATTTVPTSGGGAQILQVVGVAISTSAINTDIEQAIKLT
jgi:hypothetical protein